MEARVRLNVGGEIFETSLTTLQRAGRDSFLGALLDPAWRTQDESPAYDPNPTTFSHTVLPSSQDCHVSFAPAGADGQLAARQWTSAPSTPALASPELKPAATPLGPSGSASLASGLLVTLSDSALAQRTREGPRKGPLGPLYEHSKDMDLNSLKASLMPDAKAVAMPTPPCLVSSSPSFGSVSSFEGLPEASVNAPASSTDSSSSSGSVRRRIFSPTSTGASLSPTSPSILCSLHGTQSQEETFLTNHFALERSPMTTASKRQAGSLGSQQRPSRKVHEVFLDRDPAVFRVLLNLLRTGYLDLSPGVSGEALFAEADYLGLLDCVKGALLPPQLDANEMEKVATLSPNVGPTEICTAMCGNEDGSLTVAHGSRITAYDWSLERLATIFSELPQVDTIAHLSESLIVTGGAKGCDQLPVYNLRASSARECKVDTISCPGASHPCFRSITSSDRFLYIASLRKSLGAEWGVGKAVAVVDRETLQCIGEPGPAPLTTKRMSGPDKLQWVESRNLLLVAKRYSVWPPGGHESASYVRLWDPRCNQVVWDWREYEEPQVGNIPSDRWYALCDAVVCQDLDLLFKASPTSASDALSSRLSAIDLRCLSSSPTSGTATTTSLSATSFFSGPITPTMSSSGSTMPPTPQDRSFATGHDGWSVLQWQKAEGLRIGAHNRERYENSVLRLVAVPGTGQIICNRQPTLEVWSPVAQLLGSEQNCGKQREDGKSVEKAPFDPFMFRRGYANSREEYNRKRTSGSDMNSWVYDMALAGDHRLFVAREENRDGNVDYSSIEVWETKRNGRMKSIKMC